MFFSARRLLRARVPVESRFFAGAVRMQEGLVILDASFRPSACAVDLLIQNLGVRSGMLVITKRGLALLWVTSAL